MILVNCSLAIFRFTYLKGFGSFEFSLRIFKVCVFCMLFSYQGSLLAAQATAYL